MTFSEFKSSLQKTTPPLNTGKLLQALWYDAKGDWDTAHNLAQEIETTDGSWVHAYLHRKEGDEGNARYWYHRARKNFPKVTLEQEWEEIVNDFLNG
jgi:hypothetical protein